MILQNANATGKIVESASQTSRVFVDSVDKLLNTIVSELPYVAAGVIVLAIFWLVGKIFRSVFLAASSRSKLDDRLRILFSRLIGITLVTLGIFAALAVMIPSLRFSDFVASLGFTSFIVGFATRDILNNLLSGVLILWRQPFHIGDYIFVKDKQGKVENIGVRATRLRMDDGEMILVPNGEMYSNALVIRNAGAERRMNLQIAISYDSDIEQTKSTVHAVLVKCRGVLNEPQPEVYVTELAAEGVKLSIYFWINTDKTRPMSVYDEVATGIKNQLCARDIALFPVTGAPPKENTAVAKPDEPAREI